MTNILVGNFYNGGQSYNDGHLYSGEQTQNCRHTYNNEQYYTQQHYVQHQFDKKNKKNCAPAYSSKHKGNRVQLCDLPLLRDMKFTVVRWILQDMPSVIDDPGGLVVKDCLSTATLQMENPGVLAGLPIVDAIFESCGPDCRVFWEEYAVEGSYIDPFGDDNDGYILLATVAGPVKSILRGESVALNTLSRCSGVATLSSRFVQAFADAGWRGILDGTRKVTPGDFGIVEKYGLVVGGAGVEKIDLSRTTVLNEHHIAAAGYRKAITRIRAAAGMHHMIAIECQCFGDANESAKAGADVSSLLIVVPNIPYSDCLQILLIKFGDLMYIKAKKMFTLIFHIALHFLMTLHFSLQ
mmetsp:Transcript_3962/g.7565  ORF Transcript_3962/g.7565 Transcript_3962/m.7565 type:complete len:353 (-) Transcript_3962:329-1387(-)